MNVRAALMGTRHSSWGPLVIALGSALGAGCGEKQTGTQPAADAGERGASESMSTGVTPSITGLSADDSADPRNTDSFTAPSAADSEDAPGANVADAGSPTLPPGTPTEELQDTGDAPQTTAGSGGTSGAGAGGAGAPQEDDSGLPDGGSPETSSESAATTELAEGETDAGAPPVSPALSGPQLYVSLGCDTCHGEEGEGVSGLGPELQHPSAVHMTWIVRNGVDTPRLAAYGNAGAVQTMLAQSSAELPDAQLGELIRWLQDMPQPGTGAELFADYCAGCHGPDGRGGVVGVVGVVSAYATPFHSAPFSNKDDNLELDYVKAGHGTDPAERRGYMPAFAGVLTDAEINSILSWAHGQ